VENGIVALCISVILCYATINIQHCMMGGGPCSKGWT